MRKILSCEFNPDTACVELCMEDGTLLSIDYTAVENEVANSMYQRSELDWLIYNDPLSYAELILNGDPELYLKASNKENSVRLMAKKIRETAVSVEGILLAFLSFFRKHLDYLLTFDCHVVHLTNNLDEYVERMRE